MIYVAVLAGIVVFILLTARRTPGCGNRTWPHERTR